MCSSSFQQGSVSDNEPRHIYWLSQRPVVWPDCRVWHHGNILQTVDCCRGIMPTVEHKYWNVLNTSYAVLNTSVFTQEKPLAHSRIHDAWAATVSVSEQRKDSPWNSQKENLDKHILAKHSAKTKNSNEQWQWNIIGSAHSYLWSSTIKANLTISKLNIETFYNPTLNNMPDRNISLMVNYLSI